MSKHALAFMSHIPTVMTSFAKAKWVIVRGGLHVFRLTGALWACVDEAEAALVATGQNSFTTPLSLENI